MIVLWKSCLIANGRSTWSICCCSFKFQYCSFEEASCLS